MGSVECQEAVFWKCGAFSVWLRAEPLRAPYSCELFEYRRRVVSVWEHSEGTACGCIFTAPCASAPALLSTMRVFLRAPCIFPGCSANTQTNHYISGSLQMEAYSAAAPPSQHLAHIWRRPCSESSIPTLVYLFILKPILTFVHFLTLIYADSIFFSLNKSS